MTMAREWDVARYDTLSLPHASWGRRTVGRLSLTGHETVLDAGCGTGRDAELLLGQLPAGRVIALDGSASMIARTRERLAAHASQVDVVHADLTGAVPLRELVPGPVDAVVSVATFHWIYDHAALFASLAGVLRPGGQLVVDCGGAGNTASVWAAVHQVLGVQPLPWYFAGAQETGDRLARAGFTGIDVRLRPEPVGFSTRERLIGYLRTVVLAAELDHVPAPEHDDFLSAVADLLPGLVVDYVRLEITAVRED
jgi:trans-aconitate 2-methyltransferase